MANTVTQQTLIGAGSDRHIVRHIHIVSDGSEETDLVVYDNSTFINDVTKGKLIKLMATGSSCVCRLEWDQTTDSPIISFDPNTLGSEGICFKELNNRPNPNGAGATGDIVLSTANLDAGDEVSIFLFIRQE